MDLIRAYACGLLPNAPVIEYDDNIKEIELEAMQGIPAFTNIDFCKLAGFYGVRFWHVAGPYMSIRKLCRLLLKIYEQQSSSQEGQV